MLIKNLLYGYYDTQCLYAVSKLNVADYLKDGGKSITELAHLAHADENKLYRIMRFLSARGLFDELPNQFFALNEESRLLLSSNSENLKNFVNLHGVYFYQGATGIFASMKSELTPFEIGVGEPAWKLFEEQANVGKIYHSAMQEVSEYYSKLAIKKYNFSLYKTIIDIGGGLGSFLVNILKYNPNINGINFDLPSLKKDAENYFEREHISSRCRFVGGNFFDAIPAGGDLYLFKAIFHGKTDDQVLVILKNCKIILTETSKVLLIERMITAGDNFLDGCLNDINMLNVTKGRVRTFDEYQKIFNIIGFSISKVEPLEGALQMIELSLY